MKQIEALGARVEAGLERFDESVDSPLKASMLGVLLGIGVITGGIATFLLVLAVLVNLFA